MDKKLTILFWNGFWKWPFYGMGEGNTGFISHKCEYTNCYTTNNRKELFQADKIIDAVIVHGLDKDITDKIETSSEGIMEVSIDQYIDVIIIN